MTGTLLDTELSLSRLDLSQDLRLASPGEWKVLDVRIKVKQYQYIAWLLAAPLACGCILSSAQSLEPLSLSSLPSPLPPPLERHNKTDWQISHVSFNKRIGGGGGGVELIKAQ